MAAMLDEFGEDVTYQSAGHADTVVTMIFVDQVGENGLPGLITMGEISLDALAFTPGRGDTVIFGSDTYMVKDNPTRAYASFQLPLRKTP